MDEGWAADIEHGASRRPELIPLEYDEEGRVIDVMENVRDVEAIPYGLDLVYVKVEESARAFDICQEVLHVFTEERKDLTKEFLKRDLEGKVGFICGPDVSNYIEDPKGEGIWITIQLYRVKD